MALIPLDTAQRITQSPLEGVNSKLMQLVNLQQAQRERQRAEAMGDLKAQLLQARIKNTQAQAESRRRKYLETIRKGLAEKQEDTIKAMSEAVGKKLNSQMDARIDEVYSRRIQEESINAARELTRKDPAILEQVVQSLKLPKYNSIEEYSDEQSQAILSSILRNYSSMLENEPRTTKEGVRTQVLEKLNEDQIRNALYDTVISEYGGAMTDEVKRQYRDAIDSISREEMINSSPSQLADTITNSFKHGKVDIKPLEESRRILAQKVKANPPETPEQFDALVDLMRSQFGMTKEEAADELAKINSEGFKGVIGADK